MSCHLINKPTNAQAFFFKTLHMLSPVLTSVFSHENAIEAPPNCVKSVRMRGNADQNNSEYGHFSRGAY